MTKIKDNLGEYLLCLLLLIEPFLELNFFYKGFDIGGFQINTIIRLIIFGLLSLYMLFNFKKLKYKKFLVIYLLLVIIYSIFHHMHALNFESYIPSSLINYSLLGELFYIIRLLIPLFLIYYILNLEMDYKKITKSFIIGVIFIVLLIVGTNLLKISICSYNDSLIQGSIFSWFQNPTFSYAYLASRGYFYRVIVFYYVILFLPYIIYLFFQENKKVSLFYGLIIFLSVIAGFMVGTKATTWSVIIILIISLIMLFFFAFIKKELNFNIYKTLFLGGTLVIAFCLIPYSPMHKRIVEDENAILNNLQENLNQHEVIPNPEEINPEEVIVKNAISDLSSANSIIEDLLKDEVVNNQSDLEILISKKYNITPFLIINSYPYQYDSLFWQDFIKNTPYELRNDNRLLEQKILDRLMEVNNNKYDKLMGITYERTSKVFNLERDFLYQYYSLGILGVLLFLSPYILIVLFGGLVLLIKFKTKLTYQNCALLLGIGLILCLAYYSGNTIDYLCLTIPLSIMSGFLLKNILKKEVIK